MQCYYKVILKLLMKSFKQKTKFSDTMQIKLIKTVIQKSIIVLRWYQQKMVLYGVKKYLTKFKV